MVPPAVSWTPSTLALKKMPYKPLVTSQSDGGKSSVEVPSSRCARLTSKISHHRNEAEEARLEVHRSRELCKLSFKECFRSEVSPRAYCVWCYRVGQKCKL